jgi:hypothetical protein
MNILALDLGKYNTVSCEYSSVNDEHEFGKVKMTRDSRSNCGKGATESCVGSV